MTTQIIMTLAIIAAAMVLFAWNPVPAAVVAVCASLALYFTGILTMQETLAGFGDPVVILIAALLAIGAGLETAGVGAWAGQLLIRHTGGNETWRMVAIMIVAAVFSGMIGMNGAVAAMLPIIVVVAVRTGVAPSRLMIPLAFACLTGSKLTLLGTPVNVIAATQADEAGVGHIGFLEWSVLGIPLLAGTIVITLFFGRWLLPERRSLSIPSDFSAHAQTLVEQYRLEDGLHHLRVRSTSPYIGKARADVDLKDYVGLHLVALLEGDRATPLQRAEIAEGDLVLVRGDAETAGRFALDMHLAVREYEKADPIADVLLSRASGLAEVVIPLRSKMIGQSVFPGMTTEDGDLMILALQRGGIEMRREPVALRAGDHLLLQGTWKALDKYLSDPKVLVVDSPEVVQKQAVALGQGAPAAIAILLLLFILLAFEIVPPPIAAVLCAALMVITRVLTLPQFYRGIDWNTCILIGAMIPPATAMTKTGAAALIGDYVVGALGFAGPLAVLAGIFLVSAVMTQFISNTSSALVMMPIGLATASELGVSALPMMLGVAMGASASFLTPFANGVSLMVYGPGGYRFGDFWKLGLIVTAWAFVVTVVVIPLYWAF
ncbi:SLC13 family permease [Bradyrhizobium sp. CB3481]|uniref:SLC13 family permease n=1 Tax=Bradyrhizobium sp. CB3481 TaxID=3039158 RepID=UPI0024B120F7|nr:SLC13 family permease [Bradyrhizobium sp. CB3481]WFU20123.1 SLC13 family permease [Bradyrhizobium sp. CB3481]